MCAGRGGREPQQLSLRSHVSVSRGPSNLTSVIVHLTHTGRVSPIKFAISRYSSVNVSDSSPLSGHERGYLFQLCQAGHLGEMSVRKELLGAFSLNFSNFP